LLRSSDQHAPSQSTSFDDAIEAYEKFNPGLFSLKEEDKVEEAGISLRMKHQ